MTLLILAAGMGSRYGGLKQIDPITEEGEFIIDFSVYDACRAGFDKIVFVIKEENLDIFKETIGKRFEGKIKVEYAFQKIDDLPESFSVPEGRTKPWGTAHAMLAARNIVNEPFAVINADDFYGQNAYKSLFSHFADANEKSSYCMVGYVLENTLTENGTVSRGVCSVDENGYLTDVVERTAIKRRGDVAVFTEGDSETELSLDTVVSMNCWGFTPDVFAHVEKGFVEFLKTIDANPQKAEFYLPFAICDLMNKGICSVKAYRSEDSWYGVTYHEDRESVKQSIAKLKEDGSYPKKLS
jgi:NDP-sugar pyrophosphorylase family protein